MEGRFGKLGILKNHHHENKYHSHQVFILLIMKSGLI